MRPQLLVRAALVACIVGAVVMLVGPTGIAQQGPPPGKGGGGGHTESAVNQLSYPAVLISVGGTDAEPLEATSHVLGKTYSWGCDKPEEEYPNTSCVTVVGNLQDWMTREQCVAYCGEGYAVDRMYWQKITTNYWKAETTGPEPSVTADFLDWGDNLESRSWTTTSSIRVETTPFEDHSTNSTPTVKRGYQMWHVYGQGPSEVWGVRAQAEDDTSPFTAVYYYDSPYAIINTGSAKLHMAKLGPGAASCPATNIPTPFTGTWTYDETAQQYTWGGGSCTLRDTGYTAELNVGGKYVYGYNWQIRNDRLSCDGWVMPGWWRLTFYTPGTPAAVVFDNAGIPTAPPTLPPATPLTLSPLAEEGDGALYKPVIDIVNNLTYIDICIKSGGGKR